MAFIPYPPAPEFGWYADDQPADQSTDQPVNTPVEPDNAAPASETPVTTATTENPADAPQSLSDSGTTPTESVSSVTDAPAGTTTGADTSDTSDTPTPADSTPHAAEHDIEDWDSTVLSPSFTSKAPQKVYLLHNDLTGQTIVIDKSTLLGRKPSMDVPQGAKSERIEDPTRTTSRNHAAISIDTDGALWIEDYGSLNGTYIIKDGQETQVVKGTPLKLDAPATVRIGDQFFNFTEQTN